jgi:hypothetical protein
MSDEAGKVAAGFVGIDTMLQGVTDAITAGTAAGCAMGPLQAANDDAAAGPAQFKGVGARVTTLASTISSDSTKFVTLSVTLLSIFVLVPAGLGIGGAALSRSDLMMGASACGIGILAFLCVSMALMLSLSVASADFCMAPDKNALAVLKALNFDTEATLAKYFMRCAPGDANTVTTALNTMTGPLGGITCPAIADQITTLQGLVTTSVAAVDCATIQASYQTATYTSLCDTAVKGIYHLWVVQATTGVVFITTLIFSAFVNLDKTDAEMEDDEDTPTARSRRRRRLKEKRRKSRERKKSQAKERLVEGEEDGGLGSSHKSSRSSRSSRPGQSETDSVTSLSTTDEEEILV